MKPIKLNTSDPNQLQYENPLLQITVLGGIRLEGLDRLRVTLKIQLKLKDENLPSSGRPGGGIAVRHNLDLYNDTQVEKLIRKIAIKLEIGNSVIEASINELIELLEEYRIEQLKSKDEELKIRELTAEEKAEALQLLQSENLLQETNKLIEQSGIIGEEVNRLIMYLIFTSRKRNQPLHIISLGSSGTGKTHLQESIGNLIPPEDRLSLTSVSENAFYYYGKNDLKNKLILIEDMDGAESALYPIRELQSKKKISKTIAFKNTKGETKSQHITVEGPVCVAGCTTKESVYEDNANRSFLIYLDESLEQDARILQYQRKRYAGNIDEEAQLKAKNLLLTTQYLLQDIKIINPYAEYLELPKEVLKPRRTNAHYLQFIELITYYHQHQREKKVDEQTGEEFIEVEIEDIKNANKLLKEILLQKSDRLNYSQRKKLETFREYVQKEQLKVFENRTLRECFNISKTMARKYLLQWQETDEIEKVPTKEKQKYHYQFNPIKEYKNLQDSINRVLTEIENKLPTDNRTPTEHPMKVISKKPKNQKVKSTDNLKIKTDKRTQKLTT